MSILGKIFSMGGDRFSDANNPIFWGPNQPRMTTSGEYVNSDTAMSLPTYWACVRNISEDVGKLSIFIYRRDGRDRSRDHGHPLWPLVHDGPNPEMSSQAFYETLTQWALGWGNGYAEIVRTGRGDPAEMWPIHPSRVRVKRDKGGRPYYEVSADDVGARAVRLELRNMFHLRGMGTECEGYSVFRAAGESIGRALAVQKHGAAFFGNGLGVNIALEHPGAMGDKAIEHLRTSLSEIHAGSSRAYRPFIVEEGMTIKQISVSPEDAQALETGEYMVEEICRWFRMPPHKVQHLKRTTYNNIEHQAIEYVVDTMLPWVRRWEIEIRRKLLAPRWSETHYAEFAVESLLRADSKSRAEFYEIMQRNGNYTINMVLEKENENGIGPAGDQNFVPLNMTTAQRMLQNDSPGQHESRGSANQNGGDAVRAGSRMFVAELGRHLRKQVRAASREAEKHAGDGPGFCDWSNKFFGEQARSMTEGLTPIAEGLSEIVGGPPIAGVVAGFSADFAGHCRRTIEAAFDGGAVALALEGWNESYAAEASERLARAIIERV